MKNKGIIIISLIMAVTLLLCGCKNNKRVVVNNTDASTALSNASQTNASAQNTTTATRVYNSYDYETYFAMDTHEVTLDPKYYQSTMPWVVMKLENGGFISVLLHTEYASNIVDNFIAHIINGDYDGISFMNFDSRLGMRAVGPIVDYTLENVSSDNVWTKRSGGVLFMDKDLKTGNVSGSSFFIPLSAEYQKDYDNRLYKEYTPIGEVMEGNEYLRASAATADGQTGLLSSPIAIEKVIIDLKGYTVGEVTKITGD